MVKTNNDYLYEILSKLDNLESIIDIESYIGEKQYITVDDLKVILHTIGDTIKNQCNNNITNVNIDNTELNNTIKELGERLHTISDIINNKNTITTNNINVDNTELKELVEKLCIVCEVVCNTVKTQCSKDNVTNITIDNNSLNNTIKGLEERLHTIGDIINKKDIINNINIDNNSLINHIKELSERLYTISDVINHKDTITNVNIDNNSLNNTIKRLEERLFTIGDNIKSQCNNKDIKTTITIDNTELNNHIKDLEGIIRNIEEKNKTLEDKNKELECMIKKLGCLIEIPLDYNYYNHRIDTMSASIENLQSHIKEIDKSYGDCNIHKSCCTSCCSTKPKNFKIVTDASGNKRIVRIKNEE